MTLTWKAMIRPSGDRVAACPISERFRDLLTKTEDVQGSDALGKAAEEKATSQSTGANARRKGAELVVQLTMAAHTVAAVFWRSLS